MEKKNVLYALFLVGLMSIFAYMVWAAAGEDELMAVTIVSPLNYSSMNYSGSLLLNATTYNGTDYANATNMTFAFYNTSTGVLVYNVTLTPRQNESGNYNFTSVGTWYDWSNVTYNLTIETSDTRIFASDGIYNLTVNATNSSNGRVNITNGTEWLVMIDNTNASVVINTPVNQSYYSASVTPTFVFNVTVTDNLAGVSDVNITNGTRLLAGVLFSYSYLTDNVTKSDDFYNWTFNVTELGEGEHYFNVTANDTLNNANDSEFVVIYVDNTAPTVNLRTSPDNWTWTSDRTPSLNFNYSDATSPNGTCTLHIDNVVVATNQTINVLNDTGSSTSSGITFEPSSELGSGTHTWGVNCTDLGGNSAYSSTNYTIDVNKLTVTVPENDTWTIVPQTGNVSFIASFNSSFINSTRVNNVSCELWITNGTGNNWSAYGVNNTVKNNSEFTITNNHSLLPDTASPDGVGVNWTINCTFNDSQITQVYGDSYFVLNVDNVTPSLTTITSSVTGTTTATLTVTTSEIADCKYSTESSRVYADMTIFKTTTGTSHSTSLVSLSSGTPYTYHVKCRDRALSEVSGSTSFTTTSTTGGSGGGGSGSGISTGITAQFAQMTWASINAGETATIEVTNSEIGITQVSFTMEDTTYGAWVKVQRVDELPSTVDVFSGKTYKNIKISETNVVKAMRDKAKIKFKVAKSWLIDNKVGRDNIVMYRFVDDKWTELETGFNLDDGTYIHYTAEAPGFSYFVIGEKVGAVPVEAVEEVIGEAVQEAAIEAPVVPVVAPPAKKTWLLWIIPLVVVLAVIAWFVWFRKR